MFLSIPAPHLWFFLTEKKIYIVNLHDKTFISSKEKEQFIFKA